MESLKYDLIIIGGGLSASLTGLSLLNVSKQFKIAIIERDSEFPQKIGESTSDITSIFLRSLNIDQILKKQAGKAGLRFLFNENLSKKESEISEFSSPTLKKSIPGFHLNRKQFDEDLLNEVEKRGAIVYRPATIIHAQLKPFSYDFEIEINNLRLQLNSPRILDASGRFRYLKNQLKWKDVDTNLNTGAIMAHFKGANMNAFVSDKTKKYWDKNALNDISYCTTHLMRDHSWWWLIRLDDETTSIGVVYDKTKVTFNNPENYFNEQLVCDPQLSVIVKNATKSNINHLELLPYCSEKLFENGAAVIGDSGAFVDPFVSPGMEMICQQVMWLSKLYISDFNKKKFDLKAWTKYQKTFLNAYKFKFDLYSNWYKTMTYYDLMSSWIRISNVIYFGFQVYPSLIYRNRLKFPLHLKHFGKIGFNFYKNRMNKIANDRSIYDNLKNQKHGLVSFSGIQIRKGYMFFIVPTNILFKWVYSYLQIEIRNFKKRK